MYVFFLAAQPQFPESGTDAHPREIGYHVVLSWGCRFAFQCVSEVAQRALAAEPPSYDTIMELDRKVREFPVPPEVTAVVEGIVSPSDDEEPIPLSTSMERFVMSNSREVGKSPEDLQSFFWGCDTRLMRSRTTLLVLLWIHRSFFAQAIIDCPANPFRSNYAPSFLAAYRASVIILTTIKNQFARHPVVCSRFWLIWTYAFSAAVCSTFYPSCARLFGVLNGFDPFLGCIWYCGHEGT
jgi:hypothetical protein